MDASEEYIDDPIDEDQGDKDAPSSSKQAESKTHATLPKKAFQHKWLDMPEFKGWLQPVPGDQHAARCSCCGVVLGAGKSELSRHAQRPKHLANVKAIKSTVPAYKRFPKSNERKEHENDVKRMEVQLSAFFAEHNVAYLPAGHLVSVIKKGAEDSKIAKDITLGR